MPSNSALKQTIGAIFWGYLGSNSALKTNNRRDFLVVFCVGGNGGNFRRAGEMRGKGRLGEREEGKRRGGRAEGKGGSGAGRRPVLAGGGEEKGSGTGYWLPYTAIC